MNRLGKEKYQTSTMTSILAKKKKDQHQKKEIQKKNPPDCKLCMVLCFLEKETSRSTLEAECP